MLLPFFKLCFRVFLPAKCWYCISACRCSCNGSNRMLTNTLTSIVQFFVHWTLLSNFQTMFFQCLVYCKIVLHKSLRVLTLLLCHLWKCHSHFLYWRMIFYYVFEALTQRSSSWIKYSTNFCEVVYCLEILVWSQMLLTVISRFYRQSPWQ